MSGRYKLKRDIPLLFRIIKEYATETWERLQPSGLRPQPRAESVALAVSQLLLHPPRTTSSAAISTSSGESHHYCTSARVRPRGSGSVDRSSSNNNSSNGASTRHFHCRVSPCEPCDPGELTEEFCSNVEVYEDDCEEDDIEEVGGEVADERLVGDGDDDDDDDDDEEEESRWGSNGRRRSRPRKPNMQISFTTQHPNVPQANNNLSFLREISKISQINLSRLSRHNHCSYSVLSSDSSESICNAVGPDHMNVQSCAIGCRKDHQEIYSGCVDNGSCVSTLGKMVKSQSANVITIAGRGKGSAGRGRVRGGRNGSLRKTQDNSEVVPRLPRDPVSVPNFGAIEKSSIPPLTPVEMTRLVFLDTDDDEDGPTGGETSQKETKEVNEGSKDALIVNSPPPPATDFSALHRQFQPNGGKKRSESAHHLSDSATDSGVSGSGGAGTPVGYGGGIPKSASVRFRQQLVELEEASDETVSTSDYASIETMNCVNNSKVQTPSSMVITNLNNSGNGQKPSMAEPDGPYGFSNPNYLGPDISTILSGTSSWKGNGNLGKGENGPSSRTQPHLQLHQTYAQLLNSPPDSVLEDSNGRSCSRFFQDDLELQSLAATPSGCSVTAIPPPALQNNPPPLLPPPPTLRSAAVPQFLSLHSPLDTSGPARRCISASKGRGNGVTTGSKCRASSASRAECSFSSSGYHPPPPPPQPPPPPDPNVPLYMFIVGGKEKGQVTLFKRPISVWRLQLAPDIY
ncbi:hypothetical protein J437_LFUL011908 [Ladona fulva]|uniref:Uncharacterized protein n=1 Tax=Ladona fulva TaxID=123851 RepID=A0A8K0JTY0_LADFU|nr:hypothetical protein J437_LFUL011908 [Ladona fulva]